MASKSSVLKSCIFTLKEFVKKRDLTFNGVINSEYLESYKSTLISESDLLLKYCFTLLQNLILDEEKFYTENCLLNNKTVYILIDLIEFSIKKQTNFNFFLKALCSISKIFKCIYQISELITEIFNIENIKSYDYFCMLLFKKNFENGLEFLKALDIVCDLPSYEKNYTFENFIEDIKNGYKNIDLSNEISYVNAFKSKNKKLIPIYINNIRKKKKNYQLNEDIVKQYVEKQNEKHTESEKKEKESLKNDIDYSQEKKFIEKENKQKKFDKNDKDFNIINENVFQEEPPRKTMHDYLMEKSQYYSGNHTPVLSFILKNNVKITKEYFQFFQMNDQKAELYYDILEKLIKKFQSNKDYPDISKYGYFLYKDINGDYIESIYSTVNPELIFEFTDKDENYPEDDYSNPDKKKSHLAFKCRALSFEYYINKLFIKKYKSIEYPRVIFPFRKVKEINKDNEIIFSNEHNEEMEEIDGCYINNNNFEMIGNDIPFKAQGLGKMLSFYCPELKLNKTELGIYDGIVFNEGDLSILEIKNSFPPANYIKDGPKDFKSVVKIMLKRMLIFVQLLNELGVSFKRIRLILFYDVVKCGGYQKDLEEVFKSFYKNNKIEYKQEICFQLIYIDSNYLAKSLKTMEDKIDYLENKVEGLMEEIIELKKVINLK